MLELKHPGQGEQLGGKGQYSAFFFKQYLGFWGGLGHRRMPPRPPLKEEVEKNTKTPLLHHTPPKKKHGFGSSCPPANLVFRRKLKE